MQEGFKNVQFSLEQLKAFCAVVDKGGYQRAAESLHRSHSAIIYLVKSLETELKVQLFDRGKYRNTLTPQGEKVYHKGRELLHSATELKALCGHLVEDWEARLKIVFDGIYPFAPLLQIYQHFNKHKIPTEVQIHSDYLHDVENSARDLNADIIISVVPLEQARDWTPYSLPTIKNILVAHRDHPLNKSGKKWQLEELKDFHFLTVRNTGAQMGMNTAELESQSSFFLSDFHFKKMAIMKKIGFGWLPEHLIEHELAHEMVLPVRWERNPIHKIQPTLYLRKSSQQGKACQAILELLRNA